MGGTVVIGAGPALEEIGAREVLFAAAGSESGTGGIDFSPLAGSGKPDALDTRLAELGAGAPRSLPFP